MTDQHPAGTGDGVPGGLPPALGLPPTWAPVPVTWHHAQLTAQTPTGPVTLHLLMFDTPTGRQAFSFQADDLRALIDKLTEQVSGIAVVRTLDSVNARHG